MKKSSLTESRNKASLIITKRLHWGERVCAGRGVRPENDPDGAADCSAFLEQGSFVPRTTSLRCVRQKWSHVKQKGTHRCMTGLYP